VKFVGSLYRVPFDEHRAIARAAEDAGLDALALADHVLHVDETRSRFPYAEDGALPWQAEDDHPDVWVATAMMAAVTRHLRFLTAVYVLPAREPFGVAKALGTLARGSGHRVSFGFGIGWLREEIELMGQRFAGRGRRAEEMLDLIRRLWTGERVDFAGESYRVEGVRMRPPVGGPIPIVCAGASDAALERAARLGDGWIPPISVASPEALEPLLQEIDARRREGGRSQRAFAVYYTPMAPLDGRELARLERMGVTHVFASPWGFEEAASMPVEEKCARLREAGRRGLASMVA